MNNTKQTEVEDFKTALELERSVFKPKYDVVSKKFFSTLHECYDYISMFFSDYSPKGYASTVTIEYNLYSQNWVVTFSRWSTSE